MTAPIWRKRARATPQLLRIQPSSTKVDSAEAPLTACSLRNDFTLAGELSVYLRGAQYLRMQRGSIWVHLPLKETRCSSSTSAGTSVKASICS